MIELSTTSNGSGSGNGGGGGGKKGKMKGKNKKKGRGKNKGGGLEAVDEQRAAKSAANAAATDGGEPLDVDKAAATGAEGRDDEDPRRRQGRLPTMATATTTTTSAPVEMAIMSMEWPPMPASR